MKITEVKNRMPELTDRLLEVWKSSVRATHLFLSDGEIDSIKEYVPQALKGVPHLLIAEDDAGHPAAFGDAVHRPGGKRERTGKTPASAWHRKLWR